MTARLFTSAFVAGILCLGTACGDDASGSASADPQTSEAEACTANCEGGVPQAYPSGPYASGEDIVGRVLPDLSFTTPEGETTTFSDLRGAGGKTLMLISTTAGWCTACIEEQPKLEGFYQKYGCDGLEVVVAMFEDLNFNPATPANAREWRTQYGLSFPVLADTPNALGDYYDTAAAPLNLVVDLCTMEVLYSGVGFDESAVTAIIESNL